MIITLAPGSYNFTITYYGASDPQFCETFFLMIGIAPLALVPPEMCTANPSLPSVPDLSRFDWSTNSLLIKQSAYYYSWPTNNRATRTLYEYTFVPSTSSFLRIAIGMNFLLGDMKLVVRWNDTDRGLQELIGAHSHGMIHLSVQLPQQPITIAILTGYTAHSQLQLPQFPSCIKYTFELEYEPVGFREPCGDYVSLPFAVNTTQVLGLKEIHIQDRFLIPDRKSVV